MNAPLWLTREQVLAFHEEQLAEHGGKTGIRDDNAFESALARPQNLHAYGESDLATLAAAYAFGIAKNHPFLDGNKRTAFICAYVFLGLNGQELVMPEEKAVDITLNLAASRISQESYAKQLQAYLTPWK
ncbi:type II toxin-antitoxin system death-on-curing family toxin [Nibricoccus sp. IMCC34717]|uniref:type II toxin-antitoxin system death-on-curing family toxin n=1 Tax=Nibricoccus sp. IMCC34717 TaxID=3034021 RepID=UPI00384C8BA1